MGQKPLLDVLTGHLPRRRPIWFMRQAGRYLPEYRAVRSSAGSFLDLCYNPELAATVTLQPLSRYDIDAAILFADILVVPHAMGLDLSFKEGEGPIIETVRDARCVGRLRPISRTWQVESVCETLRQVSPRLPEDCSLIGFCGAPWTVASYMVEGGSSDRSVAVQVASEKPDWFRMLIEKLVKESVEYLSAQIAAGAEIVQIFDSWAGDLDLSLRHLWVDEPLAAMARQLRSKHPTIPIIVFARGVGSAHRDIAIATKCAAVGIEAGLSMEWARHNLAPICAVQGNLDPAILAQSENLTVEQTRSIVHSMPYDRHIFNLGHGIRPETDPRRLETVIKEIRDYDGAHGHG